MPDAYAMHDPVAADVGLLQSAYLGVTLVVSHDFQPAGGRDSRPHPWNPEVWRVPTFGRESS